jgi:hypothetical protein
MKLQMDGNSLRLRLSQSEVNQFSKTGFVEDSIQFAPGASFAFALESLSSLKAPQALYTNNWLRIQVPGVDATDWVMSDRAGISGDQALQCGKHLSISVEKDFQCDPLEATAAQS